MTRSSARAVSVLAVLQLEILRAVVTGIIGVTALAAGLEGYFIRAANWLERGIFVIAAFMLIDPGLVTDVIGLVLLVLGLGLQKMRPVVVTADASYL